MLLFRYIYPAYSDDFSSFKNCVSFSKYGLNFCLLPIISLLSIYLSIISAFRIQQYYDSVTCPWQSLHQSSDWGAPAQASLLFRTDPLDAFVSHGFSIFYCTNLPLKTHRFTCKFTTDTLCHCFFWIIWK